MRRAGLAIAACVALAVPASAAAAPGADIREACGAPFGALVAGGKSGGDAAHRDYRGGANAFSNPVVLGVHGCV